MAFTPTENRIGLPPIGSISTAAVSGAQPGQSQLVGQALAAGTIVRADDPTLGSGEFIYLPGVASTAVGSLVTYDPDGKTTTLAPNTDSLGAPVAVATAANTSSSTWGWYQIEGVATVKKVTGTAIAKGAKIYLSSTAGSITGAVSGAKAINGAIAVTSAASAATTVDVLLQRPCAATVATVTA